MAELLQDPDFREECARTLFYSENGGATIDNALAWDALASAQRTEFERRVIAETRGHVAAFSHIPAQPKVSPSRAIRFLQG